MVPGRHTRVTGLEHVDKVVGVDQSPIGRTPRSNPATYTGVFDHIRRLFAETTEAKVRGYGPGDRKSTRLNSSHANISYAVFCLKKNLVTIAVSAPGYKQ